MHVLFVHQNFPAQFGHVASNLVKEYGHRCTFVSEKPAGNFGGIECIQYVLRGGARESTHFCSRTFENQIWHSAAVFEALRARPDIKPDLIVGHSGFLTTTFLRELYDAPLPRRLSQSAGGLQRCPHEGTLWEIYVRISRITRAGSTPVSF